MNEEFLNQATRVILGETSERETLDFQETLEKDAEKNAAYKELKEVWDLSDTYKRESLAEKDWESFSSRLTAKPKQAFLRGAYQKMAIAASIVLVATVAWVTWIQVFSWESVEATASNQEIILPDNSLVVLKKGSELRYKKQFSSNRLIELKGEAWFDVTKDAAHPFRIQTKETYTTVLGTAFDIHELNEEGDVELRVAEGKVSFEAQGAQLILSKGMAARYSTTEKSLQTIEFGSMNQVTWMKQKLTFNNTDIHAVLNDIAHYYEVNISYTLPSSYCTLSGEFGTATKEEILEILEVVLELDMDVQGNTWMVRKGTCRK